MEFFKIKLILLVAFLSSCSLIGERSITAEYSLFTSVPGANIYRADGEVVGQTPLMLKWADIKDVADGRFVSFIVEKPGYFTRVVFFDVTDSVNLKIDLEVDRKYKEKRQKMAKKEIIHLQEKNEYLREQTKYLSHSIESFKKQESRFIKNMEILQARLRSSEIQLSDAKKHDGRLPSSIFNVANSKIEPPKEKHTALASKHTSSYQKEVEYLLLEKKLNQCSLEKSKQVSSQKRCPASKVKYFPPPRTNIIIRELLMAQFLIINNDFQKAKELILLLEEKNPNVAALYTLLAYIESTTGNIKKAKRYLRKSLSIDSKDKMAKRMVKMISLVEKASVKK